MKIPHLLPAALAVGVFGPLLFWILDDTPPVVVHEAVAVDPIVVRGGALVVRYEMTYSRKCAGDAQRLFIDASDVLIPIEPYRFAPGLGNERREIALGEKEVVSVSASTPVAMAPGPARYQVITEFFCNPLQRALQRGIFFKFPPIIFEVTAAPPQTPIARSRPNLIRPSDNPLRNIMPPLPDKPLTVPR